MEERQDANCGSLCLKQHGLAALAHLQLGPQARLSRATNSAQTTLMDLSLAVSQKSATLTTARHAATSVTEATTSASNQMIMLSRSYLHLGRLPLAGPARASASSVASFGKR